MWKKVVGPTLVMTFLWLSISGATTYYIFWLSDSNTRILKENVSSIRASSAMREALRKLQGAVREGATTADAQRSAQCFSEIRQFADQFLVAWEAARQSASGSDEIDLVASIAEQFREYRELVDRIQRQVAGSNGSTLPLVERAAQMTRDMAGSSAEIVTINERLIDAAVTDRAGKERLYNFVQLTFLFAGPAVGIWVGLKIARNLHQSISQISVTLKDASGDMDQEIGRVQIVGQQDVGDLSVLNDQVQLISARIRQVLSELQKARQEAVRSERLAVVGELAAGVAHEIRNPLTSVKLLMQTATRTEHEGIQLESRQAQVVLQEVLRMEETIQSLLDFARPPRLHRVHHDLRETLGRALNLIEGRARLERVAIIPRLSDAPLIVDGDPEQLHQVFVNLLINGIDSMCQGGTLHVTAESDELAGVCRVVVADCGEGIPSERIPRIFEPFITTKPRGTGLGLAVTRRIVREHGGTIVAGNRPEGGAIFTVELQSADLEESARALQAGFVSCDHAFVAAVSPK